MGLLRPSSAAENLIDREQINVRMLISVFSSDRGVDRPVVVFADEILAGLAVEVVEIGITTLRMPCRSIAVITNDSLLRDAWQVFRIAPLRQTATELARVNTWDLPSARLWL